MTEVSFSRARLRSTFDNPKELKAHLGEQLFEGRLALILGAGVSVEFGLPGWEELVDRCFDLARRSRPSGASLNASAEDLLVNGFNNDRLEFAKHVRQALYGKFPVSMGTLGSSQLLAAISALAMGSMRGSVKSVISFNFDDLLERYLQYYGLYAVSKDVLPAWDVKSDVTVYHPHGLLPSELALPVRRGIVFTQLDYDEEKDNLRDTWYPTMENIMASNICLLIGVSGCDESIRKCVAKAHIKHVSATENHAFWGVRFSDDPADPNLGMFEARGIFQHTLAYAKLPNFLFEICQAAAELRK